MKKCLVLIMLLLTMIMVGCTNNKTTNNKEVENTPILYCSSCAFESKEVAKFCSNCGVEAKWVAEKPEISKEEEKEEAPKVKEEKAKTEETKAELNKDKAEENKKSSEENYNTCWVCGKKDKLSNLKHMHGVGYYMHVKCYENSPSCKTCGNNLAGIDEDRDNTCDFCEDHVCTKCKKYYEDTYEISNGVCNNCQLYEAYKGLAVCKTCSDEVNESLAGQKCNSCGKGIYETIKK